MLSADAISPLRPRPLSRTEYHHLAATGAFDGQEVQLIEGTLVTMSPEEPPHSIAVNRLTRILQRRAPKDTVVRVQEPLAASDVSEPTPDFAITAAGRGAELPKGAWLIIEVADSSLKLDRGPKARVYARLQVPEYWVVDLRHERLVVRRLPRRGKYRSVRRFGRGRTVTSVSLPTVSLDIDEVLRPR